MKYLKKQTLVKGFLFEAGPRPEWANFLEFSNEIKTSDGLLFVLPGDYVVKGIYGGTVV